MRKRRGSSPLTRGKHPGIHQRHQRDGLIPAHAGKTASPTGAQPACRAHPRSRGKTVSGFGSGWGPGAHPRSRGENLRRNNKLSATHGSSPLTRGKLCVHAWRRGGHGLIPAHAGKTLTGMVADTDAGAHPRSRGENAGLLGSDAGTSGSSPLTRGKRAAELLNVAVEGLIPAHAGKTLDRAARSRQRGAHPRSRGENGMLELRPGGYRGSSPLTRGKLSGDWQGVWDGRLIPAHAGKTPGPATSSACKRAHPRSRGENQVGVEPENLATGSSPLTRGKRYVREGTHRIVGLIPAHAGKTCAPALVPGGSGAHPRSRGENHMPSRTRSAPTGSSPLTRGKHPPGQDRGRGHGLIPAHAGKTPLRRSSAAASAAHPRSRGENIGRDGVSDVKRGSSPLTRGKHVLTHPPRARLGLIPAHAGKTSSKRSAATSSAAHPRSRGENVIAAIAALVAIGSSPLTRGKLGAIHGRYRGRGLIPAHAGKTRRALRYRN